MGKLITIYALAVGLKDGRREPTNVVFSSLETAIKHVEKDMEEVEYIESMHLLKLEEAFENSYFVHIGTWSLKRGYGWSYGEEQSNIEFESIDDEHLCHP